MSLKRASRLMTILGHIRKLLRGNEVQVKPEDSSIATAAQTQATDHECWDALQLGTEVGRRILWQAVSSFQKNVYTVPAWMANKVFPKKESDSGKQMGCWFFRECVKKCPTALGRYDQVQDVLYVNLPDEPSAEWHAGLLEFANTTEPKLRCALRAKAEGKRGGQRVSGAASSSRQRPNDSLDSQLSAVMGDQSQG